MLTEERLEQLLSISLIRSHIADDDTERYSVEQLSFYREAAFEACENYTGLHLSGRDREIVETAHFARGFSLAATFAPRPHFHRLKHKAKTGIISISSAGGSQTIVIAPGDDRVPLSLVNETIMFGACDPHCAPPKQATTFTYIAEASTSFDRLPAGLRLGMLQYIAFIVGNPGDTVTHSVNSSTLDLSDNTDNAAMASGAISSWLPYCSRRAR